MFAMPIASGKLKLDDKAMNMVRNAVGLSLELDLCIPYHYHCGSVVDARGHSFFSVRCLAASGRSARLQVINNCESP